MSKQHIFSWYWTGWRWIMYTPLLSAGFWLTIDPTLASEYHQPVSGPMYGLASDTVQADTLCTATAEPIAGAPITVAASTALPAPLESRFRHGHGTRIDCRRRDGQWQAVEHAFQLDDVQLLARGNGDRTLRAWEDDRNNGIVRRRTLDLPAPDQWQSGSQPDTLTHRLEQRQTNRADCGSTASGQCSARQTTDTWVRTTRTGVQLVQQRYINGTFAERVSWYLSY